MSGAAERPEDVGSFASGQDDPEHFPEDREVGSFHEETDAEQAEVGSFATGEADPAKYPEDKDTGSFATGEDEAQS